MKSKDLNPADGIEDDGKEGVEWLIFNWFVISQLLLRQKRYTRQTEGQNNDNPPSRKHPLRENDDVKENEIPTANYSHKSSALYIFQNFIIVSSSATVKT